MLHLNIPRVRRVSRLLKHGRWKGGIRGRRPEIRKRGLEAHGREIEPCGGRSNPSRVGPEFPEVGANELREYGRTSLLAGRGYVRRRIWVLAGTGLDPCGGSHVRSLDASSPLRRIRQLISLIITPARTNDLHPVHAPRRNPSPSHPFSRRVIRSHDDSSSTKERGFLTSPKRNQHEHPLQHYHPKTTHKI